MSGIILSNSGKTGKAENKTAFNNLLKEQPLPFYIEYTSRGHRYRQPIINLVVYKRLTPVGDTDMWNLFTSAWFNEGPVEDNEFNVDFKLYGSYVDAVFDKNAWGFCPFTNDRNGVGFPRDCGPRHGVGGRWIRRAQCDMKINGACQGYPDMANKDWFDDNEYGGPTPTTSAACEARKQIWIGSCQNSNIEMRYRSPVRHYGWGNWTLTLYSDLFKNNTSGIQAASSNLSKALKSKIGQEEFTNREGYEGIDTMDDIFEENLSFNEFKAKFTLLVEAIESESQGNMAAHAGKYSVNHVNILKNALSQLQVVYDDIQFIKEECMKVLQILMVKRMRILYNEGGDYSDGESHTKGIDSKSFRVVINKWWLSCIRLWRLQYYNDPLKYELAKEEPEFNLDEVTHNGSRWYHNFWNKNQSNTWRTIWFTWFLCTWCKYCIDNQNLIDRSFNCFYDHLEIHGNPKFNYMNKNTKIQVIRSGRNYDMTSLGTMRFLSGRRLGSFRNWIHIAMRHPFFRANNLSIFGIDFTEIRDYLFHNSTNPTGESFRAVDGNYINSMRREYTGSRLRNEGFIDYYTKWAMSQHFYTKQYVEKLYPMKKRLKIRYNSIKPNTYITVLDEWKRIVFDEDDDLDKRHFYLFPACKSIKQRVQEMIPIKEELDNATAALSNVNKTDPNFSQLQTNVFRAKSKVAKVFYKFYSDMLVIKENPTMDYRLDRRHMFKDIYNYVPGWLNLSLNDMIASKIVDDNTLLFNSAKVDGGYELPEGSYISTNPPEFTEEEEDSFVPSMTGSSIVEGMTATSPLETQSGMDINLIKTDANRFPRNLSTASEIGYNTDMSILLDTYRYKSTQDGQTSYIEMDSYIDIYGDINETTINPSLSDTINSYITCNDTSKQANAHLEFKCGNNDMTGHYLYNGSILKETCENEHGAIDITYSLSASVANKLNEENICTVIFNIEKNKNRSTSSSNTFNLDIELSYNITTEDFENITEIVKQLNIEDTRIGWDTSKVVDTMVTTVGSASNSPELNMITKDKSLLVTNSTSENYIGALYIQDGTLKMLFKESTTTSFTDTGGNDYYYAKRNSNFYAYSNDKMVGEDMIKGAYVGYDGVYYQDSTKFDTTSTSNNYTDSSHGFTNPCFRHHDFNGTSYDNFEDARNECNRLEYPGQEQTCYGIFENTGDNSRFYLITDDTKKYLYSDDTGDNVQRGTLRIRRHKNKLSDSSTGQSTSCKHNPDDIKFVDSSVIDQIKSENDLSESSAFDESKCGLNRLLGNWDTSMNTAYDNMNQKFSELINIFNSMTEQELQYMNQTNLNSTKFKQLYDEYNSLRRDMVNKKNKNITSFALNKDTDISLKKTEYKMALTGVASMIGIIALFQMMKK